MKHEGGGARVAFLGNMNNNHFATARFLRDRGVDAEVLLFDDELDHFDPAADTYDLGYMRYTRRLSWGGERTFVATAAERIRKDLEPYSVIIGCGLAPAYCYKAGRALDIFVPYGHDLWSLTRYRFGHPLWMMRTWPSVYAQQHGIRQSRVIHFSATNEIYEPLYERYRGRSERWLEGLPTLHTSTYDAQSLLENAQHTHWAHEFDKVRREHQLMVISHARHVWKCSPDDPRAKGTDKLLRGWKMFTARHPDCTAALVMLEYGDDVGHSKALVQELGIANCVRWFPRMLRKDLMIGLSAADIVCGEFQNNWMMSGVLFEALALGKPILAWRDDTPYRQAYPDLYPVMRARDPESIAQQLGEYMQDPPRFASMGRQGRMWYEREIVDKTVNRYMDYIRRIEGSLGSAGNQPQ